MNDTPSKQTSAPARMVPPELIVAAGCLIAMITWGPRSAAGAMQLPVLQTYGWSTEAYAFAFAVQNLLWGLGQPIAGRLADAYGSQRVLISGSLLYAVGVVLMTVSTTPAAFTLTAGVIWGFGLSGCSITLIISGVGKMVPPNMRPIAFGLVGASGSFGQFVFSPLAGWLIETWNWQTACIVFAFMLGAIVPLSYLVASRSMKDSRADNNDEVDESWWKTLRDAMRDKSYMLVVIGFFTCGFQLAFITVHFQRYVVESGLSANIGYWAFALVGLFNVAGSIGAGWLCQRFPSRYVLASIYFSAFRHHADLHQSCAFAGLCADLRRAVGAVVAVDAGAYVSHCECHLRTAQFRHDLWLCLPVPSGRQFLRCVDGRHRAPDDGQLRSGLVCLDCARRSFGADFPADCRAPCCPARRARWRACAIIMDG